MGLKKINFFFKLFQIIKKYQNIMNNINPAYQKMMNTGVSSLLTFNTNLNYSLEQQPPLNYDNNYQNFMDEATKKKYGLSKIDDIFKNKNPDLSIFTFGIDLTKFGLNLNSDSE